jgi:hypothetical protein
VRAAAGHSIRWTKPAPSSNAAPARELLAELQALVDEAAVWAEAEGGERALRAVEACRLRLASTV